MGRRAARQRQVNRECSRAVQGAEELHAGDAAIVLGREDHGQHDVGRGEGELAGLGDPDERPLVLEQHDGRGQDILRRLAGCVAHPDFQLGVAADFERPVDLPRAGAVGTSSTVVGRLSTRQLKRAGGERAGCSGPRPRPGCPTIPPGPLPGAALQRQTGACRPAA